jgi:hypothetical protein
LGSSPLKRTLTLLGQDYCADRDVEDSPMRGTVVVKVIFDTHLRIRNGALLEIARALYAEEILAEPMPIEIEIPKGMPDCRTR